MKQGKPLQRKTPLRATKPMKRGKPLSSGKPTSKGGGSTLSGGGALKRATPMKRKPPAPTTKRGHEPRPERKPLRSAPPKVTPEERQTRKLVEARSDGFCEKCGTAGATDKAHRVSRGVGGGWEASNILDLCRDCHQYHHANPTRAYKGGWHLRSNSTPAEHAVWFHYAGRFGWAYLHNDGTFTWAEEVENSA